MRRHAHVGARGARRGTPSGTWKFQRAASVRFPMNDKPGLILSLPRLGELGNQGSGLRRVRLLLFDLPLGLIL